MSDLRRRRDGRSTFLVWGFFFFFFSLRSCLWPDASRPRVPAQGGRGRIAVVARGSRRTRAEATIGRPIVVPGPLLVAPLIVDLSASLRLPTRDPASSDRGCSHLGYLSLSLRARGHTHSAPTGYSGRIPRGSRADVTRRRMRVINNRSIRPIGKSNDVDHTKDEIPSRRPPTSDYTDISRFFVPYVGMKVIVLPGHWPSLSLSLLSAKWIFQ